MPVDMEALERELDTKTTPAEPKAEEKVDRGDDFAAPPEADVEVEIEVKKEPEAKKDTIVEKDEPVTEAAKEPAKTEEEPARDPSTGKFIPKARFDEAVKKERARADALERQLADMAASAKPGEGKDAAALEAQIDDVTAKYHQLLADGKLDDAKPLLKQINSINRQIARLELLPVAQEQAAATTRAQSLESLVTLYKAEFPVFDEGSEDFNQDIVTWVAHHQAVYQNSGYAPAQALQEAADLAIIKFGLREPAPKKVTKADKDAERTEAGVKKALEVSKKQPATLSDVGTDSDKAGLAKIKPSDLSQDDFSKLPESTLKRLRGDLFDRSSPYSYVLRR
jgi:hypothetical protein